MADDATSSADPQALLNFAEVGLRVDAQLEAGAVQLQNALDEFAATCTAYGSVGIDFSLADQLRDFAHRGVEFDLRMRSVAEQFVQANTGSVLNPTTGFNTDGGFATQDLGLAAFRSSAAGHSSTNRVHPNRHCAEHGGRVGRPERQVPRPLFAERFRELVSFLKRVYGPPPAAPNGTQAAA